MNQQDLSILAHSEILKDCSEEDLEHVLSSSEITNFEPGEILIKQHAQTDEMFILLDGCVSVNVVQNDEDMLINTVEAGGCVGEMSFFSGQKRTASIKAISKTQALMIKKERLKHYESTFAKLATAALRLNYQLVQEINTKLADSIRKQMDFARIFTVTTIVLIMSNMIMRMFSDILKGTNVYSDTFTWTYLFIIAIPSLIVMKVNKKGLQNFGFTLQNWKQAVMEGLGLAILSVFLLSCIVLIKSYIENKPIPPIHFEPLGFLIYAAHSTIQEFIRSIFYVSLIGVYRSRTTVANFFAALVFCTLHAQLGYFAILITFVAGFLFNAMQYRHKSLLGVIIFHLIGGWAAISMGVI